MIFDNKDRVKGIECFDPSKCELEKTRLDIFENDEVAMGCCEGCWSGCIGTCRYNSH